jgi:hypothetical protein
MGKEGKPTRAGAQSTPQSILAYTPEIESRRDDYTRLAESLLTRIELQIKYVRPRLDADISGGTIHEEEGDVNLLANAIDRHLFLAFESVDWYTPEAMKLYVEMRLLADEHATVRHTGYQESVREREAVGINHTN